LGLKYFGRNPSCNLANRFFCEAESDIAAVQRVGPSAQKDLAKAASTNTLAGASFGRSARRVSGTFAAVFNR